MKALDFCMWLDGQLKFFEEEYKDGMDVRAVLQIKRRLHDVFLHEIDPKTPDKDGSLQAAHDGKSETKPEPAADEQRSREQDRAIAAIRRDLEQSRRSGDLRIKC